MLLAARRTHGEDEARFLNIEYVFSPVDLHSHAVVLERQSADLMDLIHSSGSSETRSIARQ